MRILITGVTGFVGGHLVEALSARGGVELSGTARRLPSVPQAYLGGVELHACDLCDAAGTEALLRKVQPERIFHLAGYAHAGRSCREADAAWAGNLSATRTLYDAVQLWGGKPRILYVGSGLVYGEALQQGRAFVEDDPLRPITPYASSKAAADLLSYQYTKFPGLDIVRARPFNHIGPRQAPEYALPSFAKQIAASEQGRQPPILEAGNLMPQRDLSDVRDVVAAYLLLMERGRTGEVYNVASGEAHAMQEVLDRMLALARVRVEVRQQQHLVRAADNLYLCGDAGKLRRELGWQPRHTLEQTLADILDYWRRAVP